MSKNMPTPQDRILAERLACGRDLNAQLADIDAHGNHGASPVLRNAVLAAHGIAAPRATARLGVLFGCYRPFTTPFLLSAALRLMDRLGLEHTWLDKEYCCGSPLLGQAGDARDEVLARMRGWLEQNRALAAAKGVERLAACCPACAQVSKGLDPENQERSPYLLDVLLDALEGRPLAVHPMRVAYFEGCHTNYARNFPKVSLDWKRYRAFLDRVQGLEVADFGHGLCCKLKAGEIIEQARAQGVSALLLPCSGCVSTLSVAGRGKLQVLSFPELLLQALEQGEATAA